MRRASLLRLVPALLLAGGGVALVASVLWWASVYGLMVEAGVLSTREAVICFTDTSGLCRALATLCTQDHPLGIRVYSPDLSFFALAACGVGLLAWLAVRVAAPRARPLSPGS